MFLITAQFRASRSRGAKGKGGVVFYRVTGVEPGGVRVDRNVNSDIRGDDAGVLVTCRERILSQLRLLYCVIERLAGLRQPYGIDDVTSDFRLALAGDAKMGDVVRRSGEDFALRSDLVSVGREYRNAFRFVDGAADGGDSGNIADFLRVEAQRMRGEGRVSLSRSYLSTLSSLRDFCGGEALRFGDVDGRFVAAYSSWLASGGLSASTQSFYLRTLRGVLNRAGSRGLLTVDAGWFRDVNTRVVGESASPKTLSDNELRRLEALELSGYEGMVRDMFMFAFYCRGMELVDVANLTPENVREGYLVYRRRLKGHERRVPLGAKAREILARYGGGNHLFPLLDDAGDVQFGTTRNYVADSLRGIGERIGCARLSFSMNIGTWKALEAEVNVPELLLGAL